MRASQSVFRPGLPTSDYSRWDYRVVITENGYEGCPHEDEVENVVFPDAAARNREEGRSWELTLNHRDLPIHQVQPHASLE